MRKILVTNVLFVGCSFFATAQKKADTIVIKVGEASKVIFAIQDKKDLETLKHYNFQSLMNDMIAKLEKRDSTQITQHSSIYLKDTVIETTASGSQIESVEEWPSEEDRRRYRENGRDRSYTNRDRSSNYVSFRSRDRSGRRTYSSFNIDIGTNNFLENGKFPADANAVYTVRPWGSWYVGLNSIQRTRMANKLFLEWGGGVSWYNFKFQNDRTLLTKDDTQAYFSFDTRPDLDFKKSKLTVVYVNFSMVPVIDFGGNSKKPGLFSGRMSRGFRMGLGPYVGYRIDSYTKQVFVQNGDEKVERHHDPYYLNNIRYGARLQFGFRGTDLFFNYDLNELFVKDKAPQLNAFTFGITL